MKNQRKIVELKIPGTVSIERACDYCCLYSEKNNVDVWFEYKGIWIRITKGMKHKKALEWYNGMIEIQKKENRKNNNMCYAILIFFIIIIIFIIISK